MKKRYWMSVALLALALGGCAASSSEETQGTTEEITTTAETVTVAETETSQTETTGSWSQTLQQIVNPGGTLTLSEKPGDFSWDTAQQLIQVDSHRNAEQAKSVFRAFQLEVLHQEHYDKERLDGSHTCAYTLGKGKSLQAGTEKEVYVLAFRATLNGEWYSNVNFAPSRDSETQFAENFLAAAEDAMVVCQDMIPEDATLVVTGFSRGAACANLFGMLWQEMFPDATVYAYTFATPRTVRGSMAEKKYDYIFNIVSAADLVPKVPLASWGYERIGQDIVLESDSDQALIKTEETMMQLLSDLSPDIRSYYEVRHSMTEAGEAEDGLTMYEIMGMMADAMLRRTGGDEASVDLGSLANVVGTESDLAPFVEHALTWAEEPARELLPILMQHSPTTYQTKMVQKRAMEEKGEN